MSNQLEYDGRIEMFGEDISSMSPAEVVDHGFVHVPQDRHLFGDLTAEGNLQMGGYTQRDRIQETMAEVYELFPVLEEKRNQEARTLSGGQQQMLAVGRGLMAGPRVLALDEPSTGLAPKLTERLFERIEQISDRITVLLVEQHVTEALDLAERAYLLENGRVIAQGLSEELRDSQRLRKAYLRE
jgi:branched-chain amino acid transport system ATP-binding protein